MSKFRVIGAAVVVATGLMLGAAGTAAAAGAPSTASADFFSGSASYPVKPTATTPAPSTASAEFFTGLGSGSSAPAA
ncbi:hypothetical protein [Nocardia asteroides]|uniref:hypothetical protein n=1 Tax=Nocardia asteroides TaxID=1824 RepID=UPI001E4FB576|nr:hypothetical protein [Nocardia asteroides]UGT53907.1 hypothetical protein LTT85_25055 [Nocardia asteroides]